MRRRTHPGHRACERYEALVAGISGASCRSPLYINMCFACRALVAVLAFSDILTYRNQSCVVHFSSRSLLMVSKASLRVQLRSRPIRAMSLRITKRGHRLLVTNAFTTIRSTDRLESNISGLSLLCSTINALSGTPAHANHNMGIDGLSRTYFLSA